MTRLLIEAIAVGIIVLIVGSIVSAIFRLFTSKSLPSVCKDWNKYYVMEICLFITGFLTHIFCEMVSLNKWYCKNGLACRK